MKPCACPPCGHSHRKGDQTEEDSGHLKPHDARKSHNRCDDRTPSLFSCCLYALRVRDASRRVRRDRADLPRCTRLRVARRVRSTCRLCRLHERLDGVSSAVSQCPSKLHPIHISSLRVYGPPRSRNEFRQPDIQAPVKEISKRMKTVFWVAGAVCGAVAGLMIWNRRRDEPVEDLAHRLEAAWADHNTMA